MKDKDVVVGMKVVPHSKSRTKLGTKGLENSKRWELAQKHHQPFLYVNHIVQVDENPKEILLSDQSTIIRDGEWFLAKDFEPYIMIRRTKK